ncbi:hypothetical protein OIU74_002848 [Salix koriyanagi]|uniref:Uncharacterized protein n=1 Tax=Salix koriyanagi TaxID=2511006 RepID=A0A9Q1APL9_9ROSI|nr:hypothetical protein OIU74_002848 [Salix koriyanagi]
MATFPTVPGQPLSPSTKSHHATLYIPPSFLHSMIACKLILLVSTKTALDLMGEDYGWGTLFNNGSSDGCCYSPVRSASNGFRGTSFCSDDNSYPGDFGGRSLLPP